MVIAVFLLQKKCVNKLEGGMQALLEAMHTTAVTAAFTYHHHHHIAFV